MATKFYIDSDSKYLGGFDGETGKIPVGAIEVPSAPEDARFEWDGSQWIEPLEIKDDLIDEDREKQIADQVTLEDKVNALWLQSKGDSTEFIRIDAIIDQAAIDFPK